MYVATEENTNNPGELRFYGIFNPNNEKDFVDLSEHPGVEKHAIFRKISGSDIKVDNQMYHTDIIVTDTLFLQILDFPISAGAGNLVRPEDALITETFAKKIFGEENPIGKELYYPSMNKTLTITGVIGKPTTKSILSFNLLISSQLSSQWGYVPESLILLHPEANYTDINKQYYQFMEMKRWGYGIRFQLYPYKNVYFDNKTGDHVTFEHGNYMYVLILSFVGILLLLIGIINYISIYTVVILRRNKEFGIKKVFGAENFKIFFQLLFENLFLIAISLVIALGLSELLSPVVQHFFGFEQFPNSGFDGLLFLVLALTLPLITSITPFFRYRYASPIRSLQSIGIGNKSLLSRQSLLIFQYFITLVMITVSLFFVKQLYFMLHVDLGYRTQNIIKVPFLRNDYVSYLALSPEEFQAEQEKNHRIADELKQKMDASTLFEHWTHGRSPIEQNTNAYKFKISGGEQQETTLINADETWLKLFGIQLVDGRLWSNETDNFRNYVLITGESTLKQFGIKDYATAELEAYRRLWFTSEEEMSQNPPYRIVGVVKDFYTTHLSLKQNPITIYFWKSNERESIMASFAPGRRKEVVEFMKNLHEELVGGEFTYSFIEDEVAEVYKNDRKVAVIYSVFTVIAIFISVLGLFSLSLFDIRQRRKEIAIRKVNGALTKNIIRLLLKKYVIMLGIAFIVATPVASFAIHKYLENFAFKAPVSWWLFLVALLVTTAVSLLTLLYQIHKASNENPAEVVKTE
jgi:ABC-type antimicrobial peptide transport system permease subunit